MNEEFLYSNSWFEQKYKGYLNVRYETVKTALNLFLQQGGNLILETGTLRIGCTDGNSTLIFGEFCKKYNKRLITVDISAQNMEVAKKTTEEFKDYIAYVVEDSVAYLEKTKQHPTIDLLYLDSMDCPVVNDPNDPELVRSQQHNLSEMKAALPRLGPNSIVLLDDNNFPNGGKPKATKKFLMESGWICVYEYYQSLWIRR